MTDRVRVGRGAFVAWLLVVLWGHAAAQTVELIREGQCCSAIVYADQPSAAAREGAALLAEQLERVSGAKLPVIREGALEQVEVLDGRVKGKLKGEALSAFILVGESGLTRQLGITTDGLGAGGVLLRTFPNALVLLGPDDKTPSDPDGTRYAVITFLEDTLGFRLLWPGELGLVAPAQKTVAVPPLNKTHTPIIIQRRIRNSRYNDRLQIGLDYLGIKKVEFDKVEAITQGGDSRMPNWFKWQRLGGHMGLKSGHAFGYTWEKYHREHSEWFAMQPNGSRDLSKLRPERARLCKSNLALIDALAADKIAEIERGGSHSVSLCPNDGGSACFCMCPACKNLDPPQGRVTILWDRTSGSHQTFEYVSLTDRMVWFWNQVATRITAKVPDARLAVYAYSCYEAPPIREKLHPSLAVGFTCMHYSSDLKRRQAFDDWNAWSRATGTLFWRPNLLLFARHEGTPALYAHKLGEDLAFFAHHSLKGTDFDACMHHWATEGLNYYVLARLLWNPDMNVDAILDDYCQSGFGKAWRQMRRYFTRIEQLTDMIAARELPVTVPYTPEVVGELNGLLDAANAADVDNTVRRRIAFLRRGLNFATLQHQTYAFAAEHPDKNLSDVDRARITALQQEKWLWMRHSFREEPLAVNMPGLAWGGEPKFRKYGWKGAVSMPKPVVDADEHGRPVEIP
ncbi:MAG: DUF4838 domain-containing protein [Kiritimatiellia bacterium]